MTNNPIDIIPMTEWDAIIGSVLKRFVGLRHRDVLADPDDLRQEAWIALIDASKKFSAERGTKFTTYATMCVRFHLCKVVTKSLGNKPQQATYVPSRDSRSVAVDMNAEQSDLLNAVFDVISNEPHFDVLVEHFMNNKSYRTIAGEMGVSHTTIESRIHRLLDKLSLRLQDENSQNY